MKSAVLLLLLSAVAFADVGIVPDPTKKGETVELVGKDGSVVKFNHEDYAIVPRKPRKACPQVAACPVAEPCPACPELLTPIEPKMNTIKLFGGVGPNSEYEFGLSSPAVLHTNQGYGLVLGIGYERRLDETWSVEAIGVSNYTGLLGVGYSF